MQLDLIYWFISKGSRSFPYLLCNLFVKLDFILLSENQRQHAAMDDLSFAIEGPSSIFKVIGMVVSAFVAYKLSLGFIFFILKHFFGKLIGLPANIKKAGAWAGT